VTPFNKILFLSRSFVFVPKANASIGSACNVLDDDAPNGGVVDVFDMANTIGLGTDTFLFLTGLPASVLVTVRTRTGLDITMIEIYEQSRVGNLIELPPPPDPHSVTSSKGGVQYYPRLLVPVPSAHGIAQHPTCVSDLRECRATPTVRISQISSMQLLVRRPETLSKESPAALAYVLNNLPLLKEGTDAPLDGSVACFVLVLNGISEIPCTYKRRCKVYINGSTT